MVHRTTQPTSTPGLQSDVMEPISVDAMHKISTARNKCVEILELCDGLDAALKAAIRNRVHAIRGALSGIETDVEELMEIGEPVQPENQQWPQVYQAVGAIEALGHEARLMVVDWTLYNGIYPFVGPISGNPQ